MNMIIMEFRAELFYLVKFAFDNLKLFILSHLAIIIVIGIEFIINTFDIVKGSIIINYFSPGYYFIR